MSTTSENAYDETERQNEMDQTKRPTASRLAHRGQLSKYLNRAEEVYQSLQSGSTEVGLAEVQDLVAIISSAVTKLNLIQELDQTILSLTPDENLQSSIAEADDFAFERIIEIQKYRFFIETFNNDTKPTTTTTHQPINNKSRQVNLPNLHLPTFSGDLLQWIGFIDAFESAIHNDTGLDDIQKFQYLRAQLSGEAARCVEGLSLTNNNYVEAIELLKNRYGQTHKLINVYMKALWELPKPRENVQQMKKFYDELEGYIRGLKSLGKTEESYGDLLIPVIFEKLPSGIKTQITRDHGDSAWNLTELKKALQKEIQAGLAGQAIQSVLISDSEDETTDTSLLIHHRKRNQTSRLDRNYKIQCNYCKKDHKSRDCLIYNTLEKRMDIVKRENLCRNCLRKNHKAGDCRSRYSCSVCSDKHHTSLCGKKPQSAGHNDQNPRCDDRQMYIGVLNSQDSITVSTPVVLKTAVAEITDEKHQNSETVSILFDEGSTRTWITEETAVKLNLKPESSEILNLSIFGDTKSKQRKYDRVKLAIKTETGDVPISALVKSNITTPMSNHIKDTRNLHYLSGLKLAHPVSGRESFEIALLIGSDYYWSLVEDKVVRGNGPTAVASKLGYLLSGPLKNSSHDRCDYANFILTDDTHERDQLENFWRVETLGIKHPINEELTFENYATDCIEKAGNQYVAQLPWRPEHPPLPTNRLNTANRTRAMVRKLNNDTRKIYDRIIEDQIARGFIESIHEENESEGHYIPHHSMKKDSATTPIRVVYDCSFRTRQSPSLNDCLEKGPLLLNDLGSILMNFRTCDVGLSSDIEKAFLQVGLAEPDRKFTKFFWLSDPNDPESKFITYQFKSVLFGAACSPFILNAVIKSHLDKDKSTVANDMKSSIYVDNVVTSVKDESTAIDYYHNANRMMSDAGFKLCEWTSNNENLRHNASKDNLLNRHDVVSNLGLLWDVNQDRLKYKQAIEHSEPEIITKREIVRSVASLYDPLGLLSPVHIKSKIFIQELWKANVSWDELLPDHHITRLIVLFYHRRDKHLRIGGTVTAIRQRYWIPKIRQVVKSVLRKCVTCAIVRGSAYCRPIPPPLPVSRVTDAPPFTVTGVDYSGEIWVRGTSDMRH
ncbi:uncharacterized protein LOC141908655 [Tubulanus polymorphus]|uniref:uncharacterized protein LOC141908655 n=1 Tax=Tubulanus polymorphus TaxID=672921 RepID=UPI003DA318C5